MRSELSEPFPGLCILSAFGERRVVGPPAPKRTFGVPPGGPFDRISAALANALLDLPGEAPLWEIALGPFLLEASELMTVAVVGGPDGAFSLDRGDRLEVRPRGARAYLAVASPGPLGASRHLADPPRLGDAPLRVLPGPQAGLLDFDAFLAGNYVVGLASNRVGVRLEGRPCPHALTLPSEPAIPGVVQIPPAGEPIVLGPDGPTIGGYPKIAVVVEADLDRLARARPGDRLSFQKIPLDEARLARIEAMETANRRIAELRIGWR